MKKKCKTCVYSKYLACNNKSNFNIYCDYLSMTGHRRGCSTDKCDKYIRKEEVIKHEL